MRFTGVYIIFSYFAKIRCIVGTRENRLAEAVLMNTHNLCFEQEYEKYHYFLFEKIPFLVVIFSIYLFRRVFVMYVCKG